MNRKRALGLVLVLLAAAAPARGMGFCCPRREPTLRELAGESKVLLLGTVCAIHKGANGDGTTDVYVERAFKGGAAGLGGKSVVRLPGAINLRAGEPPQMLFFLDEDKGQLAPFEVLPATPALAEHLRRVMALDDNAPVGLLRYYFDHLEDADPDVALDAHREFGRADDDDVARAAKSVSPRKLRTWLADPKASPQRLHLYGLLLGHCGEARDAALLGRLARTLTAGEPTMIIDGVLTGYVLLDPREGWALVRQLLRDGTRPFLVRYMALRTVRYLYNVRPDVIAAKDLVEGLALLLDQKDMADLAVEEFRRWRCWEMADRVRALWSRPTHQEQIIRRTVLRYALQCPGGRAAAFVDAVRKSDPQLVADTEEVLKEEAEGTPTKDVQ